MKGCIIFYINFFPDLGQDIESILKMISSHNKEMFDKIKTEADYEIIFLPTTKEATRVEKIDFDQPFPMFKPQLSKINIDRNDKEARDD